MIRPATPADLASVQAIVQAAYVRYVARLGRPPLPMLDDYESRIRHGQVWLTPEDGEVLGLVVLEDEDDGALLLDNIAVAPAAQGQGVGRRLMAFVEAEARRRGCRLVRLYTNVLMTENRAIYARLGYVETHEVAEKGVVRVYMVKRLAAG